MDEQFAPEVDIDDVEAHGLKEIAMGLAAAGVVTTSAAGIAQASFSTSAPGMRPPAVVEQARNDIDQLTRDATAAANTLSDDAKSTADHAGAAAVKTTQDTARTALGAVADTRTKADAVIASTVGNIDEAVAQTARYATSTANTAQATAQSEVTAVRSKADATVASTYATTIAVLGAVQDLANHWVVNVGVLGAGAGAEGSITHPGGTVTLTDGTGGVVATADIHDGKAILSFDTPATGGTFHLNYPGDPLYGPTQQAWHLPKVMM